jgi:hypothetical protein
MGLIWDLFEAQQGADVQSHATDLLIVLSIVSFSLTALSATDLRSIARLPYACFTGGNMIGIT